MECRYHSGRSDVSGRSVSTVMCLTLVCLASTMTGKYLSLGFFFFFFFPHTAKRNHSTKSLNQLLRINFYTAYTFLILFH